MSKICRTIKVCMIPMSSYALKNLLFPPAFAVKQETLPDPALTTSVPRQYLGPNEARSGGQPAELLHQR